MNKEPRPVINIDTGLRFESLTAASKTFGLRVSCISNCCYGRQKTVSGFSFVFESDYDPKKHLLNENLSVGCHDDGSSYFYFKTKPKLREYYYGKKNARARAVINIDTGERFETIKQAARFYNLKESCVCDVCRGVQKTTGGFRFSYV
jgi:hypothetical protein